MNILFISCLSNSLSTGPTWSVPAQVEAQSKYDNVFWLNLSKVSQHHWSKVKAYHNVSEYDQPSINSLPKPFNRPDVVVFEGFYGGGMVEIRLALECYKYGTPYIIVPRGSLTYQAMHNKSRVKKEIAHFLFYDRFIKDAFAVQYLTEQEYQDSKYRFDVNHFILPNGFNKPSQMKTKFSSNEIRAISIARIDVYHKGLDLLLDVLCYLKKELKLANFSLTLYGPPEGDYYIVEKMILDQNLDDMVYLGGEITGEDKQNALLNADVFFLTSRFEGHPMGLIEALSYGLPCLITEGTNMRQEVTEYHAGWTCDFTFESIKNAIIEMVSNINNFSKIGYNASKLAENYEWSRLALKFHEEVEKLIQENNCQ